MQDRTKKALIWLRNDLRITDHFGFNEVSKKFRKLVVYFSIDPKNYRETPWGFKKTEVFRTQFLLETLSELKASLKAKNISLIIETKAPEVSLPQWIEQLDITDLYYQKEWLQEERNTALAVHKQLNPQVQVHTYYDQFLFHPEEVPMDLESIPEVFTVFRKQCEKMSQVRPCLGEPKIFDQKNLLDIEPQIPTLEDLGFKMYQTHPNSAFPFKGGSKAGKERIDQYFWETKKLSFYKQTRNGLLGRDYSSKFSGWLANGSLSPREIYWEVKAYEKEVKKNQSTYWMIFELLWRDYFKFISLKHGDQIFQLEGILGKNYKWHTNATSFNQWVQGETSEPFVNANMIELKKTGWMSNRGRQNVASFFAKDMLMDWRMGAAYFEAMLIDYDVHSNYGNWMYVSGVGNDPRDRKFNVRGQAERYDEGGKFQRLWNQKSLFE